MTTFFLGVFVGVFVGVLAVALTISTREKKRAERMRRAEEHVDVLLRTSSTLIKDVCDVFVAADLRFPESFKYRFIEYQSLLNAVRVRWGKGETKK